MPFKDVIRGRFKNEMNLVGADETVDDDDIDDDDDASDDDDDSDDDNDNDDDDDVNDFGLRVKCLKAYRCNFGSFSRPIKMHNLTKD